MQAPDDHAEEAPMRYALLICDEEKRQAEMSEDEAGAQMAAYMAFGEEWGARGVLQGGERLQPVTTATTVRVRDDEVVTSDGPFAETKEQLGGFYLVECKDLDEAIEVAAKIPSARHGSIEVRPIWDM
jgi:hypothetical protein